MFETRSFKLIFLKKLFLRGMTALEARAYRVLMETLVMADGQMQACLQQLSLPISSSSPPGHSPENLLEEAKQRTRCLATEGFSEPRS